MTEHGRPLDWYATLDDVPWLRTPRRIYLASSWRNPDQPTLVKRLRGAGHKVYDFRNPAPGKAGFSWPQTGHDALTIDGYRAAMDSGVAVDGFSLDWRGLNWCDTCILALPCGRSAHLEAGWCAGSGRRVIWVLNEAGWEPELMYRLGHDFVRSAA